MSSCVDRYSKKISYGPNDLRFHIIRSGRFFTSFPFNITIQDLGTLEDLYYAACARLKELLQDANLLLINGFKDPLESYFTYVDPPLSNLDAVKLADFRESLLVQEAILDSNELKDLLNRGVIENNTNINLRGDRSQIPEMQDISPVTIEPKHEVSHCQNRIDQFTGPCIVSNGICHNTEGLLAGVQGLQDTRNMNCAMIFGGLAEKYRPMIASDSASTTRAPTPEAPRADQEMGIDQSYISPYNLNERAKKLNAPGAPEMPCICDPECMCAPLCASDPTQNCLCEENGLFARVTEGMDIDDLDVPDLVRRKRQESLTSKSSASSMAHRGISTSMPLHEMTPVNGRVSVKDIHVSTQESETHLHQQKVQAWRTVNHSDEKSMQAADIGGMEGMLSMHDGSEDDFWEVPMIHVSPLRKSSLSYQEALRQPFSQQCAYPPKRSSVAERLFNSRKKANNATKRHSVAAGPDSNSGARQAFKQAGKRSFGDMSFTGLKFALRRDSQA